MNSLERVGVGGGFLLPQNAPPPLNNRWLMSRKYNRISVLGGVYPVLCLCPYQFVIPINDPDI